MPEVAPHQLGVAPKCLRCHKSPEVAAGALDALATAARDVGIERQSPGSGRRCHWNGHSLGALPPEGRPVPPRSLAPASAVGPMDLPPGVNAAACEALLEWVDSSQRKI